MHKPLYERANKGDFMTDQTLTLTLDCGDGPNGEKIGGDVVIKLRPDLAPSHVARIIEMAQVRLYDGVRFQRVHPGYMAHSGCPHGIGMGGSEIGTVSCRESASADVANTEDAVALKKKRTTKKKVD